MTSKAQGVNIWIPLVVMLSLIFIVSCGSGEDTDLTDGDQESVVDGDKESSMDGDVEDSEENTTTDGDDDSFEDEIEEEQEAIVSETIFSSYIDEEKTVAYVDLPRYLGKWYEIATYTIPFQDGCTGSTATYGVNEDNSISVTNECFLESLDGEYKIDTARAEIINSETNAELIVYFTEAFGADYWIIELDGSESEEPYEWAVVGSSLSIFLWVLSRNPQIEDTRLEMILDRLEERGYDIEKLDFTLQPEEDDNL